LRSYWASLKHTRAESVFCLRDPLPSVGEVLMLPYLIRKKYFVKAEKAKNQVSGAANLPASKSVE